MYELGDLMIGAILGLYIESLLVSVSHSVRVVCFFVRSSIEFPHSIFRILPVDIHLKASPVDFETTFNLDL